MTAGVTVVSGIAGFSSWIAVGAEGLTGLTGLDGLGGTNDFKELLLGGGGGGWRAPGFTTFFVGDPVTMACWDWGGEGLTVGASWLCLNFASVGVTEVFSGGFGWIDEEEMVFVFFSCKRKVW